MSIEHTSPPTLYEWAGGMAAFEKLTDLFYKKVLSDELLEPVFKHMSKEHQLHVAHFIAEVFGGPEMYSTEEGSHTLDVPKSPRAVRSPSSGNLLLSFASLTPLFLF